MIKISKPYGYLIGLLLTLLIYFIGQLFFFINTEKTTGKICEIRGVSRGARYSGRYEFFYVCFTTKDNIEVKAGVGSNFKYDYGDLVGIIYKRNKPTKARVNEFSALWLMHSFSYVILWGLIMAFITGIYYGTTHVVISLKPRFTIKLINT